MTEMRWLRYFVGWSFVFAMLSVVNAQDAEPIVQTQAEAFPEPPITPPDPNAVAPLPNFPAPPAQPPFSQRRRRSGNFASGMRRPSSRLYDSPNMFGDFFSPGGQVNYLTTTPFVLIDPNALGSLDPAALATIQQQLSTNATQQAFQQAPAAATLDAAVLATFENQLSASLTADVRRQIIDQQNQQSVVDANDIVVNVTFPDLSSAIVQSTPNFNIQVVLPDLTNALRPAPGQLVLVQTAGTVDLQLAGGTRHTKVMENNHTLPMDRVFLQYNHFHNALVRDEFRLPGSDINGNTTSLDVITRRRVLSVNRFTLGAEKVFENGQSSLEVRLPLIGEIPNSAGFDVESTSGNVGNLSLIAKRLVFTADDFAIATGMGLNLPTGSDARGFVGDVDWQVTNEAVHFLPFIGVAGTPAEDFFFQAFAQLDIASDGNSVDVLGDRIGKLDAQTLFSFDVSGGAWLYRDPVGRLAGLASLLELHYTTTLEDADRFGTLAGNNNSILVFGQAANRTDIWNGSVALHTLLQNGTAIRVGGVFPFSERDDKRLFDAEVNASVNIPF